jgi:hypothetical protein
MGADWNEIVMARLSWTPTIALKKEPVAWVLGGLATFAVFLFVTFKRESCRSSSKRPVETSVRPSGLPGFPSPWSGAT